MYTPYDPNSVLAFSPDLKGGRCANRSSDIPTAVPIDSPTQESLGDETQSLKALAVALTV